MPNLLTWWVGQRDPSITETLTVGGVAQDLTGATVKFQAREGSTQLVDAAAVIVSAPAGTVRYDFIAADITLPNGIFAKTRHAISVRWEVDRSGKKQYMGEALIQCLAAAPVSQDYVELEDLKKTLSLDGLSFADLDVKKVITAASRKVDEKCGYPLRRFYADADALQVRVYSPDQLDRLSIHDLVTLTSLKTDPGGDGTYEETWTATDYVLGPANAAADGRPWTRISKRPAGDFYFPVSYPESVQVTGKFGWATVPVEVEVAAKMVAHRYLKRLRESPYPVAGFALDGATVRIGPIDPDIEDLLGPFSRRILVA